MFVSLRGSPWGTPMSSRAKTQPEFRKGRYPRHLALKTGVPRGLLVPSRSAPAAAAVCLSTPESGRSTATGWRGHHFLLISRRSYPFDSKLRKKAFSQVNPTEGFSGGGGSRTPSAPVHSCWDLVQCHATQDRGVTIPSQPELYSACFP